MTGVESRSAGPGSANVAAVPYALDPRGLRVPADTPLVIHRHGSGRYSVALVVEGADGYLTESEAVAALAKWRARVGGWMTKRDAARSLGVSPKMVDVLRRAGRLDAKNVNGRVRVSLKSVQNELRRRNKPIDESSPSSAELVKGE